MGKVKVYQQEMLRLRMSLAFGVHNWAMAVEADAKRDAPVRGGHRSRMTTKRGKAGQVLIGGTLRRSIHSVTYFQGRPIAGGTDENGNRAPNYEKAGDIVGVVGTNCTYGAYVELGTVKMPARPFITPAFDANARHITQLINAGAARKR